MISTHVLDTSIGRPAGGLRVTLERAEPDGEWAHITTTATDANGRVAEMCKSAETGRYRLTFATAPYFGARSVSSFYPEVSVVFEVADAAQHYHVPLLLSPYGYSTYRGS